MESEPNEDDMQFIVPARRSCNVVAPDESLLGEKEMRQRRGEIDTGS